MRLRVLSDRYLDLFIYLGKIKQLLYDHLQTAFWINVKDG